LHVVFEGAFLVFETVVAMLAKAEAFTSHCPEVGFKAFLFQLVQRLPEYILRSLGSRATANTDNNHK
jgi:hypothetical protein